MTACTSIDPVESAPTVSNAPEITSFDPYSTEVGKLCSAEDDIKIHDDVFIKDSFTNDFSMFYSNPFPDLVLDSSYVIPSLEDSTFYIADDNFFNDPKEDTYLNGYSYSELLNDDQGRYELFDHFYDDLILYNRDITVLYGEDNRETFGPFAMGIRYKNSYLKKAIEEGLTSISQEDIMGLGYFKAGREYIIAIPNEEGQYHEVAINIYPYYGQSLIYLEYHDVQPDPYYFISPYDMSSDLSFEVIERNKQAIFSANSTMAGNYQDLDYDNLKDPEAYVYDDVLFSDVYPLDETYIQYPDVLYGSFNVINDQKATSLEPETFMLDTMLFSPGKYYGMTPHTGRLSMAMYIEDYDDSWSDNIFGIDHTTTDEPITIDEVLNHLADDNILYLDRVSVYHLEGDDKIITENDYVGNYYGGYEGYVGIGVRYKDSYLKEVLAGNVSKYNELVTDIDYYHITKARSYKIATIPNVGVIMPDEEPIQIDLLAYKGGTLIRFKNYYEANFFSDVDLDELMS